jgi:hypothetical protein
MPQIGVDLNDGLWECCVFVWIHEVSPQQLSSFDLHAWCIESSRFSAVQGCKILYHLQHIKSHI